MNGRLVVVGVQLVRDAAQRGKLKLAVIAPDASHNSLDKVVPMLRAKHIRMIEGPSAAELGAAVGTASSIYSSREAFVLSSRRPPSRGKLRTRVESARRIV